MEGSVYFNEPMANESRATRHQPGVAQEAAPAFRLDRVEDHPVLPYYYQIREILKQKILDGEWKPGDQIPSEPELQRAFGVSRATVRHAIDSLVAAGMLVRRQGKGTFVAEPKIDEILSQLLSFSEEMTLKGKRPSTSHCAVSLVRPPRPIAEALKLDARERALRIERVRCADGRPIVILTSYLPERLGIPLQEDFRGSLLDLLEQRYGIRIDYGDQVIEAASADPREAGLLQISPGAPVLIIRRTSYDSAGQPVEYVEGVYRADSYSYRVQLRRPERPLVSTTLRVAPERVTARQNPAPARSDPSSPGPATLRR